MTVETQRGADGRAWPSLWEAVTVWTRIAAMSFGGPAGQIAVMHRILVEEKRWLGEKRFLHALNFCMLLPGPEAQQLTVYIGWLMHRSLGGIIAGVLFVLPGALAILGLSYIYVVHGALWYIEGLFFGLKAAVLAIVLAAVLRIGSKALKGRAPIALAAAAFIGIFALDIAFPVIVLGAGLIGYLTSRIGWDAFTGGGHGAAKDGVDDAETLLGNGDSDTRQGLSLPLCLLFLVLWLGPVVALVATLGVDHVFSEIALFFSKMAVVTFGGAYAVLAYVAQAAVDTHGWLKPGEMLDGLGLAETTPGPLIMVTQFVGFLGAYRDAGELPPLAAGSLGALITIWVTFAPCFLWIFIGAPFVERLRGHAGLSAALAAITAAVVGVILNLAVWFALHVIFAEVGNLNWMMFSLPAPDWQSFDLAAAILSTLAIGAVFTKYYGVGRLLIAGALCGVLIQGAAIGFP